MSNAISDPNRELLLRSLPLVESHKEVLLDALRDSVGTGKPAHRLPGRPHATAAALLDLLIGRVRLYLDTGGFGDLAGTVEAHRALGMDGRHYSRFGDALPPVLNDVLGPTVPREVASAWCDAFWTIIRAARAGLEAAPEEIAHRRHAIV